MGTELCDDEYRADHICDRQDGRQANDDEGDMETPHPGRRKGVDFRQFDLPL
jgi:hypothetical protein